MNNNRPFLLIMLVLLLLAAACTPGAPAAEDQSGASPAASKPAVQPAMYNRAAWDRYAATYQISFDGASDWTYLLKTRRDQGMTEYDLHITGVSGARNPGDIRMVTDGVTTWMTGPGTDNECIQFPNGAGMDPEYLSPESLVDVAQLNRQLKLAGEDEVTGVKAQHYEQAGAAYGPWKDAQIDLWAEAASQMLVLFTFEAQGEDPFFGAGAGAVSAIYHAAQPDGKPIAPVPGCEIAVPLPESAVSFVRLPGMASFRSAENPADIQRFYQTALPQEDWSEADAPAQGENAAVLSYRRGPGAVQIQIQAVEGGGSKVQVLFLQE